MKLREENNLFKFCVRRMKDWLTWIDLRDGERSIYEWQS
jgi:hypothetical protein